MKEDPIRIVIDTLNPQTTPTPTEQESGSKPRDPLDLARVTRQLRQQMGGELRSEYLRGKTDMRDAVIDILDCSALHAERVVDTLVARGFIRFRSHAANKAGRHGSWKMTEV